MRLYYLCTADLAQGSAHYFLNYHWIDLGNGLVLLSGRFDKDTAQDNWELHSTVISLPHPLDFSPIEPQTIQLLAPLGAKPGNTTRDIRKLARTIHGLM